MIERGITPKQLSDSQTAHPAACCGVFIKKKVMRGIKSMETHIFEGNRIYYNFVRPHEGLYGKTPADAAEIGIKEGNKWEGLLKKSIERI